MSVKDRVASLKAKHKELNKPNDETIVVEPPKQAPVVKAETPKETLPLGPKKKKKKRPFVSGVERQEKRMAAKGRLPDGSEFFTRYKAASETWDGALTVPGFLQFRAMNVSGLFLLLANLDDMYRAAAAPAKVDPVEGDSCQVCGDPRGAPHGMTCHD